MTTEYLVIQVHDTETLARHIEALSQKGWRPQGGVAVIHDVSPHYRGAEWVYAQAMVRDKEPMHESA